MERWLISISTFYILNKFGLELVWADGGYNARQVNAKVAETIRYGLKSSNAATA
jgi:hypothetical protein